MISREFEPFEKTVYLASPTMHGLEKQYVLEAYEANWVSTVGANIDEVERSVGEKIGCRYAVALSTGTAALHLAVRLAGLMIYGQTAIGRGALEGKKSFALI